MKKRNNICDSFFDILFYRLTLFYKKSLTLCFDSVIMDNDDAYER